MFFFTFYVDHSWWEEMEQSLGETHDHGDKADEISSHTCIWPEKKPASAGLKTDSNQ